jgi:hypothetical protein
VVSSWRYLGTGVGFGIGVMWMTVGIGSAILTLLCAALGFGIAFIAERERASLGKLRTPKRPLEAEEASAFALDELELSHFERDDEVEYSGDEMEPVSAEASYGWPTG